MDIKTKRKSLTNDVLMSLHSSGLSDVKIGLMFGLTGEGVAYRRKKIGLPRQEYSNCKKRFSALKEVPVETLRDDYYNLTTGGFSSKYDLSKTVWLPYLRSLGIISKSENRIKSFPPLTLDQKRLIVAGMLGDGGITEEGCYYEFHSEKQVEYLRFKERLLKPYSKPVHQVTDGFEFETVTHPAFKEFREKFYRGDMGGKLIPLNVLESLWDDCILAYWFFDDGHFNDEDGTATLANFCPIREQLVELSSFLNVKYQPWHFTFSGNKFFLPKGHITDFGKLLIRFATPDLYYKIPEQCLTPEMVLRVDMGRISSFKPKFYRVTKDEDLKKRMEDGVFEYYRAKGFPYMRLTEDRFNYLADYFVKIEPKCENGFISHNPAGQNLCENFFPNIYECSRKGHRPPLTSWGEDDYLKKLIKNRFHYADKMNDSALRIGIKLTKACVSNFKPAVAKYLYSQYGFNGKILDYSCGFGSRMLAAMSLGMEYCGFEPATKTFDNLIRFGEFLKRRIGGSFEIRKVGSEIAPFRENYFGFAFSSPPYFDFEKYSDDPGQSLIKFPKFEDWVEGYWKKTMENCYKALIPEGFFGICLSSSTLGNLFDRTFSFAKEIGFHFYKDYVVPFKHVLSGGDKTETVLIFSKQPCSSEPMFYGKNTPQRKFSPSIQDDLMEVSEIKRKICTPEEVDVAVLKFKELAPDRGVSRDTYRDGALLGVPSYVLEHKWGSWNAFVISCGLVPGYEAHSPVEHTQGFLEACRASGQVLTFYEYMKVTGHPDSRLKRLFNTGRPYHHLLDELRSVALDEAKWSEFLAKMV